MRFPPEFLDRLRAQTTLSELVGKRVVLKRRGREHTGLCPFHNEKTPSFTVNDDKGFYHCFGCGAHGDAIRFLTENEGLGYREAVEKLAEMAGLSLPKMTREEIEAVKTYSTLQEVMEAACVWFEQQLREDVGNPAKEYLKGRGLTGKTAKLFRLGFAPAMRDGLKQHLMKQGVTESQLLEVGLIIKPDQGVSYDRFRARVMFPITDRRGKVVAFGGRVLPGLLDANAKDAPKYLNSPETPLFKKGEILYGYEMARQAAHKAGTVLVTEGYMDVIALRQSGIHHVVAPLGTAVTEHHLRLLWQIADEPVMCLDGDAAGQRAMNRAAELSLAFLKPGKSLKFLILPSGEDPDTLVRSQGVDAMNDLLAHHTLTLSDALWRQYASEAQTVGPERKAAVEHTLMQLAEKITDPTVKSHFRAHFRKLLWPERTAKSGEKFTSSSAARSKELMDFMKKGERNFVLQREGALLRLILEYPRLLQLGEVEDAIGSFVFSDAQLEVLRQVIMDLLSQGENDLLVSIEDAAKRLGVTATLTRIRALPFEMLKSLKTEEAIDNQQHALNLWRLLLADVNLAHMQAECRMLEADLAEEVNDESYNRLIELKKQISFTQEAANNLRQASTGAF